MLKELDVALRDHFLAILAGIDPNFDAFRIVLSLVDDEKNDILLMEKLRIGLDPIDDEDDAARVKLPFAVLQREPIRHTEFNNHASARYSRNHIQVSADETTGDARFVQVAALDISYRLRIYHDDFEMLSDLTEFWLLNAGGNFTKLTFSIPEADGEDIDATLALEEPEPVNPTLEQIRTDGLSFIQTFPITLRTILVGSAFDAKIILTNIKNIEFIP